MKFAVLILVVTLALIGRAQTNQYTRTQIAYDPTAQYHQGRAYVKGDDATKLQEGLALLRRSASAGNIDAMMLLAGTLKANDPREALKWYRLAASKGNVDAAYYAGEMIAEISTSIGQTAQARYAEAAGYFEMAAKAGHKTAARRLANFYELGSAGVKDIQRAVTLRCQIGDYDHAAYLLEQGNNPDLVRAYSLARTDFFVSGRKSDRLKKLSLKLSTEQVAAGEKAFQQFIKSNKIVPIPRD